MTTDLDPRPAAAVPPWLLELLAAGALCAAVVIWLAAERLRRRAACADSYDEGRIAGAIAGIKTYVRGYDSAAPGRAAD